jgi:hypothetical protein
MNSEQESHSLSDLSPVSPDEGRTDSPRPWRAPTVTRVSLEQTLFTPGSMVDGLTQTSTV